MLISHNAGAETVYAGAAWTVATKAGLSVVAITRVGGSLLHAVETVEKEPSHTYTVSWHRGARAACSAYARGGAARHGPEVLGRSRRAARSAIADPVSIEQPERLLVLAGEDRRSTAREVR